jgi:hypothetical protein
MSSIEANSTAWIDSLYRDELIAELKCRGQVTGNAKKGMLIARLQEVKKNFISCKNKFLLIF